MLIMLTADVRYHADAFHAALRFLASQRSQYLDEEIVLAFSANSRGCNPRGTPGNYFTQQGADVGDLAPRFLDVRDVCAVPSVRCTASPDWNG